jgi:spore maturation protein CgeB
MATELPPLTIGFLGVQKWGSDPRALATAFRSRGHALVERSFDEYLPQQWQHPVLRIARRGLQGWCAADYNEAVLELLGIPSLAFLLVFKGRLLRRSTLERFKEAGLPCYLFYPDVSFHDHGPEIPACLPLYDQIFTTKRYHLDAPPGSIPPDRWTWVNHGADPEVHRPVALTDSARSTYGADVSFVGCWSPKKERLLAAVVETLPHRSLRIWGPGWGRAEAPVREAWQGRGAWGDELAMIYAASSINLGLLSEAGTGTVSGDQTTARTWQIPSSGSFLLHEDTPEFSEFFQPGIEAGVFAGADELVHRIEYYLRTEEARERIRRAGLDRSLVSGYTYLPAALAIETYHRNRPASGARTHS